MNIHGVEAVGTAFVAATPIYSSTHPSKKTISRSGKPERELAAESPTRKENEFGQPSSGGLTVTCTNLTFSIVVGRRKQRSPITLLKDVNLYLRPGEMTAVLGPSGCGKTTLLDVLAGRKAHLESSVLYDGKPPTLDFLRQNVGYVEQSDTLLSMLTPYEMLLYTAELKHARRRPLSEKNAQVELLVAQLGLQACRNTVIGSSARRGISGGEAKRVNIGIALVTNPRALYVDEVTSGLDSYTGHEVLEVVRALAHSGITTCCSVHSPPPYTFALFDRMLVLQAGRVVYFGPSGGTEAASYFHTAFPGLREMRPEEGVADFVIDVTTRVNRDKAKAAQFADAYAVSQLCSENQRAVESAAAFPERETARGDLEAGTVVSLPSRASSTSPNSDWWALLVLWRYRSLKSYRLPAFIAPRLFDKVMIVFLVVTLWWQIGDDYVAVAGVLFLWSMLSAFASMGILPTIVLERPVYRRERADGLYTPAAYAFYKLSEEMIPQVPAGLIYSALVFYLVGLKGSFLLFWLIYLTSTAISIAMTFLVSACSPTTSVAGALLSSYSTMLFFFSGYLIPYDSIPVYWRWFATIDHLRYAFGSMMANQFSGNDPLAFGPQTVLQYYDLEGVNAWAWLGYLATFFPVFAALLWAALVWFKHIKR